MATKTLPKVSYNDSEWLSEALCLKLGIPTEWFYPDEESRQYEHEAEVVEVCDQCPVRPQCLDYALRSNEEFAIWGGAKVNQRVKIKTKQRVGWDAFVEETADAVSHVENLLLHGEV